ncbi:MAG TPA: phytanoyl-CoA dioxygenase family protein, partial [Caulobacteraceae bacterium]|nr:phytanoyl-CoA dioxygenase family protein [Caulobacteraceae bacterium]
PMARMPFAALPARDWAAAARALDEDGVVHLPGALTPGGLAMIEAAVERALANPSDHGRRFYQDEEATFFEDTGHRMIEVVREAGVAATVEALWGLFDFWYLGEQLFLKEGGHARRTPWHQDTSYLRMLGSQLVACWISLDPLPKSHCLEFVRGSHRGTLYNGSSFAAHDDTAPLYKHSLLPRLPDIQAAREDWDILSWDVEPGDLIVFHLGTLHGGAGVEPGMRRRTVSLRFLGPNVVFDGRPRDEKGAQEGNDAALSGMYAGLKHGDPFRTGALAKV